MHTMYSFLNQLPRRVVTTFGNGTPLRHSHQISSGIMTQWTMEGDLATSWGDRSYLSNTSVATCQEVENGISSRFQNSIAGDWRIRSKRGKFLSSFGHIYYIEQ